MGHRRSHDGRRQLLLLLRLCNVVWDYSRYGWSRHLLIRWWWWFCRAQTCKGYTAFPRRRLASHGGRCMLWFHDFFAFPFFLALRVSLSVSFVQSSILGVFARLPVKGLLSSVNANVWSRAAKWWMHFNHCWACGFTGCIISASAVNSKNPSVHPPMKRMSRTTWWIGKANFWKRKPLLTKLLVAAECSPK